MPNKNEKISLASRIVYRDENCVVVNKISGEAVEGAREGMTDLSLELAEFMSITKNSSALADETSVLEKSPLWPRPAHRLDVPATGCSLFACNEGSLAFLNKVFAGGTKDRVQKRYWAITEKPALAESNIADEGELVHWLKYDNKKNKSYIYDEEAPDTKKAVMKYRIIGNGDNYVFMEVDLITGRRHQIRAQLAKAGMCVKGDLKYGARRSEKNGGIRLHAHSLVFPNPARKTEKISVTALPPVMDNLWDSFKKAYMDKIDS